MSLRGAPEAALRNLRQSVRALAKTPGFSAAVAVTLALGIGANSAVFSAVDAVLLRPMPFPHAERLVKLAQSVRGDSQPFVAPVRLEDWNRLSATFQAISGWYSQDDSELSGDLPEKVRHAFVAPRFLEVWGVAPALGRDFSPAEEHFGGPNAVLISDRFWRHRFGADPHVIGKAVRIGRSFDSHRRRHAGIVPLSRTRCRSLVHQPQRRAVRAQPRPHVVQRHWPHEAGRYRGTGARQPGRGSSRSRAAVPQTGRQDLRHRRAAARGYRRRSTQVALDPLRFGYRCCC